MRSLTRGFAGLPDDFGQAESRFGRSCSVPGEPLLAYLLGDCAPKAIAAKFGCEKYHKRTENTGDNARGEGAVAWVDPTACPTEIQQKRTCLRIPAQSRNSHAVETCSQCADPSYPRRTFECGGGRRGQRTGSRSLQHGNSGSEQEFVNTCVFAGFLSDRLLGPPMPPHLLHMRCRQCFLTFCGNFHVRTWPQLLSGYNPLKGRLKRGSPGTEQLFPNREPVCPKASGRPADPSVKDRIVDIPQ